MSILFETKCKSCGGVWISPTDDDFCDPCVNAGAVKKCANCGSGNTHPVDMEADCNCGVFVCWDCEAETSKDGELISTYA